MNEPNELSHLSALSSELSRVDWPEPFEVETLQSLLLFLRNPTPDNKQDNLLVENDDKTSSNIPLDSSNNKEQTKPEIKLSWDEDTHPELLSAYFEETPDLVKELCHFLKNYTNDNTNKDERHNASRLAHTIKGGSAVVGITGLADAAYCLEKILDYSVSHELPTETCSRLATSSVNLEKLFHDIQNKQADPVEFLPVLTDLEKCANALEEANDEQPLELSTLNLPDFISNDNDISIEKEQEKERKDDSPTLIFDSKEDTHHLLEEIESADIQEVIEDINQPKSVKGIDSDSLVIDTTSQSESSERNDEKSTSSLTIDSDSSDFCAELDDITMTLITINSESEKAIENIQAYTNELERLDLLAEISGYKEISEISQWCQTNLSLLSKDKAKSSQNFIASGEAWSWIELISACLSDPEDLSYISALNDSLCDKNWPEPLPTEKLQAVLLKLRSTTKTEENFESDKQPLTSNETENSPAFTHSTTTAHDAEEEQEISSPNDETSSEIISWDEDVHPELLAVYLQETPEQIADVAALLHKISKGNADKDDHKQAARIAHTIKGASGVLGIDSLVKLTHKLEDILDYSVDHELPEQISELLAESSDCLESLFESIQSKQAEPAEYAPILEKLIKSAEQLINEKDDEKNLDLENDLEMPELPEFIKASSKEKKKATPHDVTINNKYSGNTDTYKNSTSNNISSNASETTIRVPVSVIDKLLNLAGELVTTSSQVADKIDKTFQTQVNIKEQDKRVHKMLSELSETIDQQEKEQTNLLSSLKDSDFDALEMDTYNELHSIVGLLTESILDGETIENTVTQQLNELNDHVRQLDQLNKELSNVILDSRMLSVNTLVPRLERIVRETCRKTGKKAELIVTGNDINIDTDIINGLVDPLLHLLRNAIDHGLESPEDRKKNNKVKLGKIQLNFKRKGNFVQMELIDDGKGIDPEVIYQRAIDKGLITPEQEFSKSDMLKLILKAGFTTQDNVSDISGRGVGMDVVKSAIEDLKGSLSIESEIGKGTTFSIKIPLTLVTSTTLLVEAAGNQVAIPSDSIEQLYYLSPDEVINRDNQYFFIYEENEIAIQSLASLLNWQTVAIDFTKAQTLLLITHEDTLSAVHIEHIMNSKEVVIKSLTPWVNSRKGVIGACHLPDGSVAPVLNLSQILSLKDKQTDSTNYSKQSESEDQQSSKAPESRDSDETPTILVVDDSLSNRKALSLMIEQTDYHVVTAVDGLDALNIINEQPISLVFTDLEMPRMNGLDLTQSIRAWQANKDMPIVMITSRTTGKHRQLAEKAGVNDYLTKPVVREVLLDSIEQWIKQDAFANT